MLSKIGEVMTVGVTKTGGSIFLLKQSMIHHL